MLHPEPYALLVDVDDRIPILFGGFLYSAAGNNACVVDQDIETTEFALASLDCGAPVGGSSDVEVKRDDRSRAAAGVDVGGGLAALVVEHVSDHDLGALANEKAGFSSALSSRAARDQSNFAFEPIHRICLVDSLFNQIKSYPRSIESKLLPRFSIACVRVNRCRSRPGSGRCVRRAQVRPCERASVYAKI